MGCDERRTATHSRRLNVDSRASGVAHQQGGGVEINKSELTIAIGEVAE